jgi:hypothetical protein
MTASKWPDRVENFQKELIQQPENYVA